MKLIMLLSIVVISSASCSAMLPRLLLIPRTTEDRMAFWARYTKNRENNLKKQSEAKDAEKVTHVSATPEINNEIITHISATPDQEDLDAESSDDNDILIHGVPIKHDQLVSWWLRCSNEEKKSIIKTLGIADKKILELYDAEWFKEYTSAETENDTSSESSYSPFTSPKYSDSNDDISPENL